MLDDAFDPRWRAILFLRVLNLASNAAPIRPNERGAAVVRQELERSVVLQEVW